eukprot:1081458-Amphidinium_carterae.1
MGGDMCTSDDRRVFCGGARMPIGEDLHLLYVGTVTWVVRMHVAHGRKLRRFLSGLFSVASQNTMSMKVATP